MTDKPRSREAIEAEEDAFIEGADVRLLNSLLLGYEDRIKSTKWYIGFWESIISNSEKVLAERRALKLKIIQDGVAGNEDKMPSENVIEWLEQRIPNTKKELELAQYELARAIKERDKIKELLNKKLRKYFF